MENLFKKQQVKFEVNRIQIVSSGVSIVHHLRSHLSILILRNFEFKIKHKSIW